MGDSLGDGHAQFNDCQRYNVPLCMMCPETFVRKFGNTYNRVLDLRSPANQAILNCMQYATCVDIEAAWSTHACNANFCRAHKVDCVWWGLHSPPPSPTPAAACSPRLTLSVILFFLLSPPFCSCSVRRCLVRTSRRSTHPSSLQEQAKEGQQYSGERHSGRGALSSYRTSNARVASVRE